MEQVKIKQKRKKVKVNNVDLNSKNDHIDNSIENIDANSVKSSVDDETCSSTNSSKLQNKAAISDEFSIDNESLKLSSPNESNSTINTDSSFEIMHNITLTTLTNVEDLKASPQSVTSEYLTILENHSASKNSSVAPIILSAEKPTAPSYKELNILVNELQKVNLEIEKSNSDKVIHQEVKPFTFEEIENIFGMNEIIEARTFAVEFEKHELQSPAHTHPLYEALTEYQRARSQLIANEKKIDLLVNDYKGHLRCIWNVKDCIKKAGEKCGDGLYFSQTYNYTYAKFEKSFFSDLQNDLKSLRSKAGEIHALNSHSEHFLKIQIDEYLWNSVNNGTDSIKESLRILFWVLRTSGWGYDKLLRQQLRNWCYFLANALLDKEDSLANSLYILHHVFRVSQGIRWALGVIRCSVNSVNDIGKAICMLEIILTSKSNVEQIEKRQSDKIARRIRLNSSGDNENDLTIGCEADESLWTIVDSDGEGADMDMLEIQNMPKENDVLGLIRQIPFKNIFRELMLIKNNGSEDVFCGINLSGGSVLKVFAAIRLILKIIRNGLILYKHYLELTKELCRITLHSVMYCTDLWESACSQCEAGLIERVSVEYNNVFLAGWSTIKMAASKDISLMFLSELPFKLCLSQHISDLFKSLFDTLVVADSVQCYYTFVIFSNMAISRTEEQFIVMIIKTLFEIGYISDFSELGCGEWARTLCGNIFNIYPQHIGIALNIIPAKISSKWFNDLPLNLWRPESGEIINILTKWENDKLELIPHLLKALDWKCQGGLSLHIQIDVAIFLCNLAEKLSQPKKPPPEWIWECVLLLNLHLIEWEHDISSAPHPNTFCTLNISGKCQITNFVLISMSSWGHSYPQIFQFATPHLIKLANSGRFSEVIHLLYYIIPIISEVPESIKECKIFIELLQIIIQAEKSYTKMATRLVTQDFPGPIIKMFADMIRSQLKCFSKFRMTSINNIVSTWINWLTSQDNWQSDWIIIYLLDVVIGCCFLHYNCMVEAANIFKQFIQFPTSSKSPTSSSLSNWFWNNSSSFKSLIQCTMEAPFLWHVILWIEHTHLEKETGIWQKLIEQLTFHNEKTKVNIDKTLKAIGGGDNSSILVIYRSLQCAINTSISHPIVTLLWQLFFYLYLDISFLQPNPNYKPVGPLFFQGLINSRILSKAKSRLLETKAYHEKKANELLITDNPLNKMYDDRIAYHNQQSQIMSTFHIWLDENFFQENNSDHISTNPHFNKMRSLIAGYSNTWIDTIDMHELKNLQNSSYSSTVSDLDNYTIDDSSEPSSLIKNNTLNMSPDEKILHRLKSYDDPVKEPLEKIEIDGLITVDPVVFSDPSKVFLLVQTHLQEIRRLSKKYYSDCYKLSEVDTKLSKLIPILYEERKFLKTITKSCGVNCVESARIILQGIESIYKKEVDDNINMNRNVHELIITDLTKPYKNLATNTAIINKLAQLSCNGSILSSENGVVFFSLIMNALSAEILKCPPAKQILNTIASLLGEKFVSGNGRQCAAFIEHYYKDSENISLICSLLRPLELSTDEMLNLYETVSTSLPNVHVAFSCLSKFHISSWLKDVRPPVAVRSRLIKHICNALGYIGYDAPEEKLSLQELLCIHLTHVLSWEYPVHLSQVVSHFSELTLEKKLPSSCWEHCTTVIETYPHRLGHRQASIIMETFGQRWWSIRNINGCSGLHNNYGNYIPCIGRFGASMTSVILNSTMLQQPVLLMHQITTVVFNAMTALWNVWLVPWWGGTQTIWQTDPRNPIILPWNANDINGPETILEAFAETITFCINTLPGSNTDFLRHTWQWYVNNFPNMSVPSYILNKVHKSLIKIPWSNNSNHWISYADLRILCQISNLNLPQCHSFAIQCLGDKRWSLWIANLSPTLQPNALYLLLSIFFKLRPEKNVLVDATSLPWNMLKYDHFEEILNWFMFSFKNSSKPFYSDELFSLLCAMAGFKTPSEYSEIWQVRRVSLINAWIGNLTVYSQEIIDAKQKIKLNESIASNVTDLLKIIETNTANLVASNESQQLLESTILLNNAIMMLNTVSLQDIAIKSWIDWISVASKISIMGLIRCILNVTQRNIFVNLAEHTLFTYFKNKGKWTFVRDAWKNNSIVPVEYLILNNYYLTGFATYLSLDASKYDGKLFDLVHKRIIQTFHGSEAKCTSETKICLWISYMISLLCDSSLIEENYKYIFDNLLIILEKWSQEPSWEIFKAIRLVQSIAPSYKFRIITRYTYCAIIDLNDKLCGDGNALYMQNDSAFRKVCSSLETMIEQKQYSETKHTLIKYVEYSKDKKHTQQNILKRVTDLCNELYLDANYLIDTFELLDQ